MRCTLLSAFLAAVLLATPMLAQAQSDRPPRDRLEEQIRKVKGSYLGVATSPAPKSLRHQVELPEGVGLVVDAVAPDSPAAEAGLKQHDLLHKLNEQLLINPQQLAVLVRTFKPDETIKLTIIRAGKAVELSAKLVERDLPPLDELRLFMDLRLLDNRDDLLNPPGRRGGGPVGDSVDPYPIPGLLRDNFTITMAHRNGTVTITASSQTMVMVAKDKDGKELFNGPIDTPEQRKAMSPDLQALMTAALSARNHCELENPPDDGKPVSTQPGRGDSRRRQD